MEVEALDSVVISDKEGADIVKVTPAGGPLVRCAGSIEEDCASQQGHGRTEQLCDIEVRTNSCDFSTEPIFVGDQIVDDAVCTYDVVDVVCVYDDVCANDVCTNSGGFPVHDENAGNQTNSNQLDRVFAGDNDSHDNWAGQGTERPPASDLVARDGGWGGSMGAPLRWVGGGIGGGGGGGGVPLTN